MTRLAGKLRFVLSCCLACVAPGLAGAVPQGHVAIVERGSWSDRLVTYAGTVYSGIDGAGDLYFALDEDGSTGEPDGRLDRIYLVQLSRAERGWEVVSEPFSGWISYWGDRLEVGASEGRLVARAFVTSEGSANAVQRWLEQSSALPRTLRAVGLVENVPSAERATSVEDFLSRVSDSDAQRSMRVAGIYEEDIRNPDPGGGGGSGGSNCSSGGPGSSSCSTSYGGDGCSVSCQAGFYACCEGGGIVTAPKCYCVRQ